MNVEVAGVIVVRRQEDPHSCRVSRLASSSHEHGTPGGPRLEKTH